MDAAANVPFSSMVTVMARNGVNFGIRISGTGDRWFQAPANAVEGLFFPGFGVDDAAADLGDSAITETAGVGGFAMASSPAIVKFVGGTPADATNNSRRMQAITLGGNPAFTLPALNFAPTAAGIDARKVTDRGILPVINTGIARPPLDGRYPRVIDPSAGAQTSGGRANWCRDHHCADGLFCRRCTCTGGDRRKGEPSWLSHWLSSRLAAMRSFRTSNAIVFPINMLQ
ncbi:hypothetical protein EIMP300_07510 [Escherichia coli]|uniref:Uncharacterized protein n=1 Tax=Escherichia coli TaxID=562 RepID=A0A8S0FFB7_ECOLX|nr:hypothetical protein EIMP300_07510 [Escherichia coli]